MTLSSSCRISRTQDITREISTRERSAKLYGEYLQYIIMPQITEKLLEAEEKKLRVLKAEIEASKHVDAAKDSSKVMTLQQRPYFICCYF